jgi:hypothetical protein
MPQLRCERCGMMADVCSEGVLTDGNFGDIPSKPQGIRLGMRYVLLCPKCGLETQDVLYSSNETAFRNYPDR